MSKWNFSKEPGGNEPFYNADVEASKRNVIATEKGWIRRDTYTDTHGNVRSKEEVIVAANPALAGAFDGYANSAYLGFPDISAITLSPSPYANNVEMFIYVSFNEPLANTAGSPAPTLVASNTAAGAAPGTLTGNTSLLFADNTLVFSFTPLAAGTYEVGAQTVGGSPTFVSVNGGEAANLIIDATTSSALGTWIVV
jgi:hypothetical protein